MALLLWHVMKCDNRYAVSLLFVCVVITSECMPKTALLLFHLAVLVTA